MQGTEVVDLQKFRDAEIEKTRPDADDPQFLPSGTSLLVGQYRLEGYLNCGGFGITYAARDSLNRKIVIKECFPGEMVYRDGKKMVSRSPRYKDELSAIVRNFVTEAHSLAALKHPNIVHVHQIFEENGTAYIAMDFIDGPDLLDLLEAKRHLQPRQVQKLTRTMLDAIGYVHRMGMLHRDISPDNILVDRAGEPVLIDFGAARAQAQAAHQAPTKVKFVKDGYSPQEFYDHGAGQGTASDLYSFAASIYHLISGTAPVDAETRKNALAAQKTDPYQPLVGNQPGYPQRFLAAIDTALSLMPEDRIQSAKAWIDQITPVSSRLSVISRPASAVVESLSVFEEVPVSSIASRVAGDRTLLVAGIAGIAVLAATGYILSQVSDAEPAAAAKVETSETAPVGTETATLLTPPVETAPSIPPLTMMDFRSPSYEGSGPGFEFGGMYGETFAASIPAVLPVPAVTRPPSLRVASLTADGPELGPASPETDLPAVAAITRPETATTLPRPDVVQSLPEVAVPLAPPPPLTTKLDIQQFQPAATDRSAAGLGAFDPAPPAVHVAALPRATADAKVSADTVPPTSEEAGLPLPAQIAYSYWDAAMPFASVLETAGGKTVAKITQIAPDADLDASGQWIAPGAIITEYDGDPLREGTPLSVMVLGSMDMQEDGYSRAPVAYRDAVMGFAGQGELAVPVVRRIGLTDGTVFETRKSGEGWATTVRSLGSSQTALQTGDVVIGEVQTNLWFDGYQSVEAALTDLAEKGLRDAEFRILRDGTRDTAYWGLSDR